MERGFKFQTTFGAVAVGRILESDILDGCVGFENLTYVCWLNPAYVFSFVRGQSPRYVCCVQMERGFKFSDDL